MMNGAQKLESLFIATLLAFALPFGLVSQAGTVNAANNAGNAPGTAIVDWRTDVVDNKPDWGEDQVSIERYENAFSPNMIGVVNSTSAFGLYAKNGTIKWEKQILEETGLTAPTLGRDKNLVYGVLVYEPPSSEENVLVGLDIYTGEQLWSIGAERGAGARAERTFGPLYIFRLSSDGQTAIPEIAAINPQTGEDKWTVQLNELSYDPTKKAILSFSIVHVGGQSSDKVVAATSVGSKSMVFRPNGIGNGINWKQEVEGLKPEVAADRSKVYVLTDDTDSVAGADTNSPDIVTTLDMESGSIENSVKLPDRGLSEPVGTDGTVYVSEAHAAVSGDRIRGYDAETGNRILNRTTQNGYSRPVSTNAGEIFIQDGGDGLEVFRAGDGLLAVNRTPSYGFGGLGQSEAPVVVRGSPSSENWFADVFTAAINGSIARLNMYAPRETSGYSYTPTPGTPTDTPTPSPSPTDTPRPTESGGGGGDGGGAQGELVSQSQSATINVEAGSVRSATIEFEDAVSGSVSVTSLESRPAGVTAPPGNALSTLDIRVPESAKHRPATIRLSIDRQAIEERGVEPGSLAVYRYSDTTSSNEEVPSTVESVTDNTVELRVDTPGFSVFTVVTTETTTPASTDQSTASQSPTGTMTATSTTIQGKESTSAPPTGTDGADQSSLSDRATTDATSPGFGAVLAITIVVAVALLVRRQF
jgi:PGF-pre-PGF domain-containing protein